MVSFIFTKGHILWSKKSNHLKISKMISVASTLIPFISPSLLILVANISSSKSKEELNRTALIVFGYFVFLPFRMGWLLVILSLFGGGLFTHFNLCYFDSTTFAGNDIANW